MKEIFRQGWQEVLKVEEVSDADDFFNAGGNSIMAVQLPAWLVQKGIKLDIMDIFMSPTFGELAEKLQETDPLYMPEEMITKEVAARAMGFASVEEGEKIERGINAGLKDQQVCSSAGQTNGQQVCTPAGQTNDQQVCTPAGQTNNMQVCSPAGQTNGQQVCSPVGQMINSQICTPAQQSFPFCMPVQQGFWFYPPMQQGFLFSAPIQQGFQVCTPNMNQGYSAANAENIPEPLKKYFPKAADKPIEKPNVVKIQEVKLAEKTKSPEQALMDVMVGILPSFNRDKDFFEQGLSSLDSVKMVTRCGEAGYKLELKDIYMHSTFDELLGYLK